MALDNNNHSVFILNYRLILTVKIINGVLTDDISDRLKNIFDYVATHYNITRMGWEYSDNYLDVVFKAHPNTELSKFINAYKSSGSRLIKKDFPELQDKLQEGQFWSRSFFLLTINEAEEDIIRAYLSKQGSVIHRNKRDINNTREGTNL